METGLDYAQARYFASAQGRFTGADPLPASARPGAPQTWNRYAYALNNPLKYTDPSGLAAEDDAQGTGKRINPPLPVIPQPDVPPPVMPPATRTPTSATGPVVPDDWSTPPGLSPFEQSKLFAERALGLPACQALFQVSGVNGQAHFRELSQAGRVRLADASVMITLPNGQTVRLIDTDIGGTVIDGVLYINPNSPIVNGTAKGYGEPGVPTPIQMTGGLIIHEELHEAGALPAEMGFSVEEIIQQSKKNDLTVNNFCVDPAARREARPRR